MVRFIRTRRWENRLSLKSFEITHNCKRETSRQSKTDISRKQNNNNNRRTSTLGSVIGSKTFKKESYIKELVSKWCEELTKPQAVYAAFTSGYKHKFSYFMRTVNCINYFMSLVEQIIKEKLVVKEIA